MARGVVNYWPSILLTIVLVIGIAACFRRLDNLIVDEVRALISVLFGFATTCLFLSYIWLIQRKPLVSRTWPNQTFPIGVDVPSMHPRGRTDSINSTLIEIPIRTISSAELEKPPTYEDALINSKPINWGEKSATANIVDSNTGSSTSESASSPYCSCARSQQSTTLLTATEHIDNNQTNKHDDETKRSSLNVKHPVCPQCSKILSRDGTKNQPSTTTTHDKSTTTKLGPADSAQNRKTSYTQLDVSQLMNLSSSPPRYSDLLHHHLLQQQQQRGKANP